MNIVERVKSMLLSPKTEWPKVAAEPMTAQQIYVRWVMILAAIGPIATVIGIGFAFGFGFGLRLAVANYLITLVMVALVALVADLLAPHFGGTKDYVAALKLSAFAYTPAFVAGILHLLGGVGGVLFLIVALYSWYLFHLGAPVLRKAASDKSLVFTLAVAVAALILGVLFAAAIGMDPAVPGRT